MWFRVVSRVCKINLKLDANQGFARIPLKMTPLASSEVIRSPYIGWCCLEGIYCSGVGVHDSRKGLLGNPKMKLPGKWKMESTGLRRF